MNTFASQRLKYFDRPTDQLRKRTDIDPAEVVHAYADAGLSVKDCADRFMTSPTVIVDALHRNGALSKFERPPVRRAPAQETETRAQPESRASSGPVAAVLKEMGVKDPGAYVRAAAIDMAAQDLVDQVLKAESEQTIRWAKRQRTAAQLAAMDGPAMNAVLELGTPLPEGQALSEVNRPRVRSSQPGGSRRA